MVDRRTSRPSEAWPVDGLSCAVSDMPIAIAPVLVPVQMITLRSLFHSLDVNRRVSVNLHKFLPCTIAFTSSEFSDRSGQSAILFCRATVQPFDVGNLFHPLHRERTQTLFDIDTCRHPIRGRSDDLRGVTAIKFPCTLETMSASRLALFIEQDQHVTFTVRTFTRIYMRSGFRHIGLRVSQTRKDSPRRYLMVCLRSLF